VRRGTPKYRSASGVRGAPGRRPCRSPADISVPAGPNRRSGRESPKYRLASPVWRLSAPDPEQTIAAEWRSVAQGLEGLSRPGGQGRPDELRMWRERPSISHGVLDHHEQPHRPLMAIGEVLALAGVAPIMGLEVQDHPVDLRIDDLGRPEEPDVTRLAVIAGTDLQRCLPRWVRDCAEELGDGQLPRVAERVAAPGIRSNYDIQADSLTDRAQRRDADAGISLLDSSLGVGRDASTPAGLRPCQPVLAASRPDLAAHRLTLDLRAASTQPTRCHSTERHPPMISIGAYRSITRRLFGARRHEARSVARNAEISVSNRREGRAGAASTPIPSRYIGRCRRTRPERPGNADISAGV